MSTYKFSQYMLLNSKFKPLNSIRSLSRNVDLGCNNPYMEKYAEKIAKVRKMLPEDFTQSLGMNLKITEDSTSHIKSNKVHIDKKEVKISHLQRQKDLSQIMKLEAVQENSAQEIESIWKEYHKIKDGVYAVLPAKSFDKMHSNLKEYPVFFIYIAKSSRI